ncbi:alpha/beta-hydrolase [Obba rivulosa]|uniref:Alpha/beta-hydrolase n=1 Tax=Obba rivulosa TaxID=1052685 RepID=A0A8E2DRY4_9APHY|nr:alpha/beta-hydrolase [Obba rivulosa]
MSSTPNAAANDDQRASVAARLGSFFSSLQLSLPSSSSEPPSRRSEELTSDMRRTRTRPPTPSLPTARPGSAAARYRPPSRPHSIAMPLECSGSSAPAHDMPHPVIRWLSGSHARGPSKAHAGKSPDRSCAPTPSPRDSPAPSSPSTPSSAADALADALCDDPHIVQAYSQAQPEAVDLPQRPEAARLPPHFRPPKPPSFLSSLSRTTMPTACLSPTSPTPFGTRYADPFENPFPPDSESSQDFDMFLSPTPIPVPIPHTPAPAHLNRSPPSRSTASTRSSLDTLRSIHERGRGLHTSTPSQSLKFGLPDSIKNWFNSDEGTNKENMDPYLNEEDKAATPEEQRERIRQKYVSPKNPVVFCHGLLGFDTVTLGALQVSHWRGIKDALESNDCEVLITRVPATSSPIDRAKVLMEKIDEAYPGRSVHLIGHSMGGLDCRYLTTHLTERKFKVLSITTISSPHRGSSFADHFLSTVGRERLPSVLSLLDMLPNGGGDGKAFEFLTVENMRKFNDQTPDVPGVKYFSWGAVYEPGLIDTWKWPHSVILEKEGPNDGLVSLKSAKWGTYLGTLEGVNHLDLVGWINTARYKWAEIMGREIKFKPATFYLGIADHLARVAEGQEQEQELPARAGASAAIEAPERVSSAEREEIRREGERAEMADSLDRAHDHPTSHECDIPDGERTARPS